MNPGQAMDAIVRYFETLTPESAARLEKVYLPDARFQDPFHTVQGTPAISALYVRMFTTFEAPRFVVTERLAGPGQCFLCWELRFHWRRSGSLGPQQVIRGVSHLLLAPDGRIADHRDYWDAASELYEKLPVLRILMRWLRRRAAAA